MLETFMGSPQRVMIFWVCGQRPHTQNHYLHTTTPLCCVAAYRTATQRTGEPLFWKKLLYGD